MINQCQMTKFQCQMNVEVYISNLDFVIWIYVENKVVETLSPFVIPAKAGIHFSLAGFPLARE